MRGRDRSRKKEEEIRTNRWRESEHVCVKERRVTDKNKCRELL